MCRLLSWSFLGLILEIALSFINVVYAEDFVVDILLADRTAVEDQVDLDPSALMSSSALKGCPPGWIKKTTNRNHPQGCWTQYEYPNTGTGRAFCTEIRSRFLGLCWDIDITTILRDSDDHRFDEMIIQ